MKLHLPFVLAGLTGLLASGCVLTNKTASYDGLASDTATARDLSQLAGQAADQLAQTYAPARTRLLLTRTPGAFGEALENRLRTHGFAVFEPDSGADGLVVEYTADRLEQDGLAPSVYARIKTSDGTMFTVSRRLRLQPDPLEPPAGMPVVAPAFAVPPMPPNVKETALTETPAPQASVSAGSVMSRETEKAMVTPERKEATPASVPVPVQPVAPLSGRPSVALPKAVLTVLPYNWRYTIPDEDRRTAMVGAPGNVPWRDAIMTMARESGCEARFDNIARRVTLVAAGPLPAAGASTSAPMGGPVSGSVAAVSALHPASLPEQVSSTVPPTAAVTPSSPSVSPAPVTITPAVAEGKPAPGGNLSSSVQPPAASEPLPVVPAAASDPTPPEVALALAASAIPLEAWELASGSSLCNQLESWGEKAGYQVIYKGKNDYMLETSATFRGTFFSAVKELFAALHKGGIPLRATLHDGNNVLEIVEE